MIQVIATTPYTDQKMGTAGLRKKSKVVMQEHYFENFLQSIFNTIDPAGKTFVVGGDRPFLQQHRHPETDQDGGRQRG